MKFFADREEKFDALQAEIDNLFSELKGYSASTEPEEYDNITKQIQKLKLLQAELKKSSSWRPSPDAVVGAVVSLASVVLILNFEKLDSITSKAINFVPKVK